MRKFFAQKTGCVLGKPFGFVGTERNKTQQKVTLLVTTFCNYYHTPNLRRCQRNKGFVCKNDVFGRKIILLTAKNTHTGVEKRQIWARNATCTTLATGALSIRRSSCGKHLVRACQNKTKCLRQPRAKAGFWAVCNGNLVQNVLRQNCLQLWCISNTMTTMQKSQLTVAIFVCLLTCTTILWYNIQSRGKSLQNTKRRKCTCNKRYEKLKVLTQ